MDRIDNEILTLLLKDARVTLSEISNQVNLSVSAVGERLKKLENSGMIQQYTTILNPKAFHKDLTVIMLVTLNNFADKQGNNTIFLPANPDGVESIRTQILSALKAK